MMPRLSGTAEYLWNRGDQPPQEYTELRARALTDDSTCSIHTDPFGDYDMLITRIKETYYPDRRLWTAEVEMESMVIPANGSAGETIRLSVAEPRFVVRR